MSLDSPCSPFSIFHSCMPLIDWIFCWALMCHSHGLLCLALCKPQGADPAGYPWNFSLVLSGASAEGQHFTLTASVGPRTLL